MWETSSEIRKRQRLRRPFPIGCAGRSPSRAIFFTVTGLILRKFAASSGVTNGSLSSAAFTVLLHFNPFSHSESLTLNMALRMCRACMVLAGVDGRAV